MRVPACLMALFLGASPAWAQTPPGSGMSLQADAEAEIPPEFAVRAGRLPSEVIVAITQSGKDAGDAEAKARELATREGLRFILQSQMPDKSAALMQMLEPEHQKSLVRRMVASDEIKTVATYKATIRVLFDAAGLEGVLGRKLIDQTHDQPKTVLSPAAGQAALVIPIWAKDGKSQIWEPDNAWRKAVATAALQESKGRLIAPIGDPADMRAITEATVTNLTFAQAAPMAERYGVAEVLIASATPMAGNNLKVQIQRLSPEGSDRQELLVAPEGDIDAAGVMRKAASELAAFARRRFQNAAAASAQEAQQTHKVRVLAPITRAADWASMRTRLKGLPMVEAVDPITIGTEAVELDLTFRGPPDRFGAALKGAGIHATPQADKLLLGFYPIPE